MAWLLLPDELQEMGESIGRVTSGCPRGLRESRIGFGAVNGHQILDSSGPLMVLSRLAPSSDRLLLSENPKTDHIMMPACAMVGQFKYVEAPTMKVTLTLFSLP